VSLPSAEDAEAEADSGVTKNLGTQAAQRRPTSIAYGYDSTYQRLHSTSLLQNKTIPIPTKLYGFL